MKRLERKMEHEHIVMAALPELSLKILDYAREQACDGERYGCSHRHEPQYTERAFSQAGR